MGISLTIERMERARSLSQDELERVRVAIRALIEESGSQVAAAKRIGVAQPTLSNALSGLRPPGVALARRVALATGITLDDLLTGRSAASGRRETTILYDATRPVLGAMPGYAEAEKIARAANPRIPDDVWREVRELRGAAFQAPTPSGLLAGAQMIQDLRGPVLRPDQPGDGLREYPDDGERPPAVTKKGR